MAEETAKQEEVKEETVATEATEEKKEIPAKFKSLIEEIDKLSVLDLSELVSTLEDHYGVSAAAPAAVAVSGAAGADEAAADEGKSSYNIMLNAAGDKKIDVIKAVREISGLGLAESKAVVDGVPQMVKENVPAEEAEAAKKSLEEAGATVELQ
ncbi:MAG: 50S ribosomal protein L7/L12 [Candidatus Saccharibacteria bacterium]